MYTQIKTAYGAGTRPFVYTAYQFTTSPYSSSSPRPLALVLNDAASLWDCEALRFFLGGLDDLLGENAPECHVYDARNGVRALQTEIIPHLTHTEGIYDYVITFGERASFEVTNLIIQRPGIFRQVFAGITDPVGLGLTQTLEAPSQWVSGIMRKEANFEELVSIMQHLQGTRSQSVLLPIDYRTNPDTYAATHYYNALKKHGYSINPVVLVPDIDAKLQLSASNFEDSVLCFDLSFATMRHTKSLIELCNERGMLMAAADLTSVFHGAALGCGSNPGDLGNRLSRLMHEYLTNSRAFATTALLQLEESSEVRFNPSTFEKQGVVVDAFNRSCLNACSIYSLSS